MNPDVGTVVQFMLLERVHEGPIAGFANLYRDDDDGIWLPVALILDGWLPDLPPLQHGEELPDRRSSDPWRRTGDRGHRQPGDDTPIWPDCATKAMRWSAGQTRLGNLHGARRLQQNHPPRAREAGLLAGQPAERPAV